MFEFEKTDRRLKKVEKELDGMRFILSKDKRDKIIKTSEKELKDVANDLNVVRKEKMKLRIQILGKKQRKLRMI